MAGVLKVTTKVSLTGLGEELSINSDEVTMTVPVEWQSGYCITDAYDTESLQISDLAPEISLTYMYGMYIKAESGTIYIALDTTGTTAIAAATSHLTINEGEAAWIPITPNATANSGITINGASATDAFSWYVFASA